MVATALIVTGCTRSEQVGNWVATDPPEAVSRTMPIEAELADGTYWGSIRESSGEVGFVLAVARFGDECERWAQEVGLEMGCPNDYAVEEVGQRVVTLLPDARITVAAPSAPGTSWQISSELLTALAAGQVTDAPEGYDWVPFPFLLTIAGGEVVAADQYWVP